MIQLVLCSKKMPVILSTWHAGVIVNLASPIYWHPLLDSLVKFAPQITGVLAPPSAPFSHY